jgi:bifunctional DNase/RNase
MKEVKKIEISENPNTNFNVYLILLDNEKELIRINIERLTADIVTSELNSYDKYKKSIWDICGELLKPKIQGDYIIEKEINKEYFGYFTLEDGEKLYIRPSDGIIIAFSLDIPVYLSNELYKDEEKEETLEEINEKIKKAIAEENYDLAEELKQKRNKKG